MKAGARAGQQVHGISTLTEKGHGAMKPKSRAASVGHRFKSAAKLCCSACELFLDKLLL